MPYRRVGEFNYLGNQVRITKKIEGENSIRFVIKAGTEKITMTGEWIASARQFVRIDQSSNKITRDGKKKLPGHIPYLGAEALGYMVDTGIVDVYVSSPLALRSEGTNKGLKYLQTDERWRRRLEVFPGVEPDTVVIIRRGRH